MKTLFFLVILVQLLSISNAQAQSDTVGVNQIASADDPSQFLTRLEVFNELQHYTNDIYLNQSIFRTTVKLGNQFTTRLDIPYVFNSISQETNKQSGLGDISFRLLGYKLIQTPKSAVTASIELSLNTAQSPLLGAGRNLVIPVISYSRVFKEKRILMAFVFQQANSFSGNDSREDISFSKLQAIMINMWSKSIRTVIMPEWYLDYIHGGLSMNMEGRVVLVPKPRFNIWAQAGVGVFGDFVGRYQWSTEIGLRYFLLKNKNFKK
jgi:hypothetical protein